MSAKSGRCSTVAQRTLMEPAGRHAQFGHRLGDSEKDARACLSDLLNSGAATAPSRPPQQTLLTQNEFTLRGMNVHRHTARRHCLKFLTGIPVLFRRRLDRDAMLAPLSDLGRAV
jgi:hypothetical protein